MGTTVKAMIPDTEVVRCPRCQTMHSLKEWNDASYAQCKSREMKRSYTKLTEERAFNAKRNAFYLCPECNQWARGSQLIIESDDPRLVKLGRKSVISCDED